MKQPRNSARWALVVAIALMASSLFAVMLQLDAGFGDESKNGGLPGNWAFHKYAGYMPEADVEVVDVPDIGKAIHYHNVRGKSGSAINTLDRRAAQPRGKDGAACRRH